MFVTWKVEDVWDVFGVIPTGILVYILFITICIMANGGDPLFWAEWKEGKGNPKSNYPRHCKIFLYQTI